MSKPGKQSAVVVAQLLSTEGFTDYTANQVKRYWMASVMDRRRRGRVENIKRAFSKLVAEKLDEGDRLVLGRFVALMEKMGFDTGLRIGLTAFLHGANVGPEFEEKYAKQEQDLDDFAGAVIELRKLVQFASTAFCDPASVDRDPAAANFKQWADAALAKVTVGKPPGESPRKSVRT